MKAPEGHDLSRHTCCSWAARRRCRLHERARRLNAPIDSIGPILSIPSASSSVSSSSDATSTSPTFGTSPSTGTRPAWTPDSNDVSPKVKLVAAQYVETTVSQP